MSIIASLAFAVLTATPQTLPAQISRAAPGDTIRLAPGDYGELMLRNRHFSPALTIEAGDAQLKVVLNGSSGFHFKNGRYAMIEPLVPDQPGPKGANGYAVYIRESKDIRIEDASFKDSMRGIVMARATDIVARNLKFESMFVDGINIANSQRVMVDNIECRAPAPHMGLHPDCVQLWSSPNRGKPTADITIQNSYAHGSSQGITAFNHSKKGQTGFDRIKLLNNRTEVNRPHGIFINDCRNCEIVGNVAKVIPGGKFGVSWVKAVNCTDCVVKNNSDISRLPRKRR